MKREKKGKNADREIGVPGETMARSEIILYQTEDGRTRVECRFEDQTVWLTQALMAELFQVSPQNVTIHLKSIYAEGELDETATCKEYLQVRAEGGRQVSRALKHYSLPVILAVGYRVRSHRGTQFRQWATSRLTEYLVKGFTMDDERLKNPPGPGQTDYFEELLERIRDIRSSERRFYQKILDIYATSVDYTPDSKLSQRFFATVQNKMHWAAHGQTAAEVIEERADAAQPFMGLKTTRPGGIIRRHDTAGAKNYLTEKELAILNRIVSLYIEFAELQALERKPMTMRDWIAKLDEFLSISGRRLLDHSGRAKPLIADYVLVFRNTKLAVVEAKHYASKLAVRFAYAANGRGLYGIDMETGREGELPAYLGPEERLCPSGCLAGPLLGGALRGQGRQPPDPLLPGHRRRAGAGGCRRRPAAHSVDAGYRHGQPNVIGAIFSGFQLYLYQQSVA